MRTSTSRRGCGASRSGGGMTGQSEQLRDDWTITVDPRARRSILGFSFGTLRVLQYCTFHARPSQRAPSPILRRPHVARSVAESSYSQDDRVAHQLCGGEERRPQRLGQVGGVFPGRDQDCVRIVRQDGQSLGFRCAVSSNSTLLVQN